MRLAGTLGSLVAGVVLTACSLAASPQASPPAAPPPTFPAAQIARGAQLAAVGDCIGCHTPEGGAPFSGGLAMATPFGTVFSSNITPDADHGIGRWELPAFERAMREGVSRDGHRLYPAFPYDHFTHLRDEDLAALYAYLMSRTPSQQATPPAAMHPPFGFRPLMAGWNLLYLDHGAIANRPDRSAEWNRGAYLADALGHCGACHSPRNALGAERPGYDGARAEGWYAPPLNNRSPSPIAWTVPALTDYLRTGMTADHAIAGGPMQGVVAQLANADLADVQAIATYFIDVMGPPSPERRQRAEGAMARANSPLASAATGHPDDSLGASVYASACAACHDLGRQASSGSGLRLPLAVAVYDADPASLLRIVREGIAPRDDQRGRTMPAFGESLSDEQLTALAAWLRQEAAREPPWPRLAQAVRETHLKAHE